MSNFPRQNKRRNSALLYEFLIKHISKCIVEDKKEEAQKTLDISKKYFSEGAPLRNELKLFQSVLNSKVSSVENMNKIVEYACKSAALMNNNILDEQKSKLIKDINYNLNKDVYNYKIPNYVNFSSLQLLFNESRAKNKKLNEIDKIKLQDSLVSRIFENKNIKETKVSLNPEYNNAVYKILVNKFHEKYSSKLTENQKKFLIQYTSYLISEDKRPLNENIKNEVLRITKSLRNIKDKTILENKDLMKKINECISKLHSMNFITINEQKVLQFLEFINLADEISGN